MVTRNSDGPFDLDYNLEIVKVPEEYRRDLRHLKDTIRVLLDRAAGMKCFSESQDSTSCLTALRHSKDESKIEFSFDVAIVTRNSKGNFYRLIHNKNALGFGADQYVWNEIADSHDVAQKAKRLKSEGLWLDVRNRYIERKNMYLSRQWDKDHPSFVVYVEIVNETYYEYFG